MWAASWALNGFLGTGILQSPTCHIIDHELSAFYDITHGHGATPGTSFQHIALMQQVKGITTEWLEPVDYSEFQKLK